MSKKKLNDLKINLYLKELNLLELEKEYADEFTSYHKPLFMEDASKHGYVAPIITGESISCGIKKDIPFEVSEKELKTIKSIFRSIAKECHPDKSKSSVRIKWYQESQIAYEKNDLLTLYKIAKKLNIEVDFETNGFTLIQKTIEEKKKELQSISKSFLWLWANSETQEEKDEIIKQFINQTNQ
jgi:hypothetical protein